MKKKVNQKQFIAIIKNAFDGYTDDYSSILNSMSIAFGEYGKRLKETYKGEYSGAIELEISEQIYQELDNLGVYDEVRGA